MAAVREAVISLAIETSGRHGSVALGRGDALLGARELGEKRRHNIGLMPAVDALCREHGVGPRDLGEVYVSLGPGSFTGLRVGLATAKMLALGVGAKLVGVPTIEVLAWQAAVGRGVPAPGLDHVAVVLNSKRGTAYSAVFRRAGEGGCAAPVGVVEPGLRTLGELWDLAPRPVGVVAEKLDAGELPEGAALLPAEYAVARAETTWRVGRAMAKGGAFADAATLSPLYVREPEAVTLWNEREKRERAAAPRR